MATDTIQTAGEPATVPLSQIQVVDGFNPRARVEAADLERLCESIRLHGVLVPVLVRPVEGREYAFVAGHRRLAAAAKAGLTEVPAYMRAASDESDGLELAAIENMARVDLNPVEEALAFRRLFDSGPYRPRSRATSQLRAATGKSDRIDAISAAKRVLEGEGVATPRRRGILIAFRALLIASRSAVSERTRILNRLQALNATAPIA